MTFDQLGTLLLYNSFFDQVTKKYNTVFSSKKPLTKTGLQQQSLVQITGNDYIKIFLKPRASLKKKGSKILDERTVKEDR